MRIISGRFKGRRLVSFNEKHIRPTTDRVKESIFNKLMSHLDGARVLDLFSGTGNLALEALSRGATRILCVEMSKKSVVIIKKNIDLLAVEDEVEVMNRDIFKVLPTLAPDSFDIVFLDPPFTEKIADKALQALSKSTCLCNGGVAVIESGCGETVADEYGQLRLYDQKDFGDKRLSLYRKEG